MEIWEDKYGTPLEDGCSVWVELDGGYLLEDIVKFGEPEIRYDGAKMWVEIEGTSAHDRQSKILLARHVVKK